MFQRKIDELFQGLAKVFGIMDGILIAGFTDMSRDHDASLNKILSICRQANFSLTKTIVCSGIQLCYCSGR